MRSSLILTFIFAVSTLAAGQAKAEEPLLLLDLEKISVHDWSKSPPMLVGYKFKKMDIKKKWTNKETGEQAPASLTWEEMLNNSRNIGDFEVNNRIKKYKPGYGDFEALTSITWRGAKEISKTKELCLPIWQRYKRKLGEPVVENDRSEQAETLNFELMEMQWIIGSTSFIASCSSMSSELPSGNKKAVAMLLSSMTAQNESQSRRLTPVTALKCEYLPTKMLPKDGGLPIDIKGYTFEFIVDVDKTRLSNLKGYPLDKKLSVETNAIVSSFDIKGTKFDIYISRLDGSSKLSMEISEGKFSTNGTCQKLDLQKKLF